MIRHALNWAAVDRDALAEHLQDARIERSQALGESNLYHCHDASGETIAIALPGGSGLIIGLAAPAPAKFERRKKTRGERPARPK